MVDACDNGTHEPRPKPLLVQTAAHEIGECLRTDVPLFAQAVHVDFVAEGVGDGLDVGGETCQAQVDGGRVREDLGEVVGDGERL